MFEAKACDDQDACTEDSCDAETGQCVNQRINVDDNDACTIDNCDAQLGVTHRRVQCSTADKCKKLTGCAPEDGCQYEDVVCDDNDPCTTDSCDPARGCVYEQKSCDDNNMCTKDSCNAETGQCVNKAIVPPPCKDVCFKHKCDPEKGILRVPRSCDDGNVCTEEECVPGFGCKYTRKSCDDNNLCTMDACSAKKQECIHRDINCDDGDPCTIDECKPDQGATHRPRCVARNKCETVKCVPCTPSEGAPGGRALRAHGRGLRRWQRVHAGPVRPQHTGKCVHEEKVCLCVAGNVQKCAPDSGECEHQPVCKADAERGRRCGPTMMTRACATCA